MICAKNVVVDRIVLQNCLYKLGYQKTRHKELFIFHILKETVILHLMSLQMKSNSSSENHGNYFNPQLLKM